MANGRRRGRGRGPNAQPPGMWGPRDAGHGRGGTAGRAGEGRGGHAEIAGRRGRGGRAGGGGPNLAVAEQPVLQAPAADPEPAELQEALAPQFVPPHLLEVADPQLAGLYADIQQEMELAWECQAHVNILLPMAALANDEASFMKANVHGLQATVRASMEDLRKRIATIPNGHLIFVPDDLA